MAQFNLRDRLVKNIDDVKGKGRSSGFQFDYDLYYPKLILQSDTPVHISFLTDWLRMPTVRSHWDEVENNGYGFCEESMYKGSCDLCTAARKKEPKKKDESGKKARKNFPVEEALALVYVHDYVGADGRGLIKEKEDGTPYEMDIIYVAPIRKGKGGVNFATLMEANNEHPNFPDPLDFYTVDESKDLYRIKKDTLINNFLMYKENGGDKVWQYLKSGSGTDTVYTLNGGISDAKLKANLGLDKAPMVPKEVRTFFDNQEVEKLFAHGCVHYKNVRQEDLGGIKLPVEGDNNPKFKFKAGKVDANQKL